MNAKFNFLLPDDLLERIRVIAQQKGKTVSAIINELLRDFADGGSEIEEIKQRLATLEDQMKELKKKGNA